MKFKSESEYDLAQRPYTATNPAQRHETTNTGFARKYHIFPSSPLRKNGMLTPSTAPSV
jgi:hypothetical protein